MKSYSERAEATRKKIATYKAQRRKRILIGAVSLCSCFFIAFSLVLFLPSTTYPGDSTGSNDTDSEYGPGDSTGSNNTDSEYSEVITKLNDIWKLHGGITGDMEPDAEAPGDSDSAGDAGSADGEHYEETTDNQVAGVIEGDLIKRTNKFVYYLAVQDGYSPKLRVYPLAGSQTECIAQFTVPAQQGSYYYSRNAEMYLSESGDVVTVVLPVGKNEKVYESGKYYYTNYRYYTEVVNIDVSNHADIKVAERYFVSGYYVSSRIVNGELLLVTNFSVPYKVDFKDEELFIPSTGDLGDMKLIPARNIHCPKAPAYAQFTVICTVDSRTLEETGSEAFLSYSGEVYVSANNIYLANENSAYYNLFLDKSHGLRGDDYHYEYASTTEISRVEYGGELKYKGSFTVEGRIINRYCMDEKDGVLRVVTSPFRIEYVYGVDYINRYVTNGASLYCVDIENYNVVGKLENFAPADDTVQSARFEGDKVYVCTAVVMTDPVFAIDISNYNDIHFVDTGEIPGYSIALRKFYGDTLLGIGYEGTSRSDRNLKIELYKETENAVESAAVFTYLDENNGYNGHNYDYAGVTISSRYKAYFIDAERGLVGLGIDVLVYDYGYGNYSTTYCRYILLQYDGESLNLLLDINLEEKLSYNFYDYTRGVYMDGTFYVFTENGFTATELDI